MSNGFPFLLGFENRSYVRTGPLWTMQRFHHYCCSLYRWEMWRSLH